MSKKLVVSVFVCAASAALFSLLNIVYNVDIAAAAFPFALTFTAILSLTAYRTLLFDAAAAKLPRIRRVFQYVPFALLIAFVLRRAGGQDTSKTLDIVSVLVWLIASIVSQYTLYQLAEKRVYALNSCLAENRPTESEKPHGIKRFFYELFEWVDALVQAVFFVALINIFIVQLYEIPSESMVPEFLVRDRVVVFKTPSGSRFPLADVGIPRVRTYKRGDIVVFRNPHYSQDRKSEFRSFVSQLAFMISFTALKLNVDEDGRLKADPLVKRVVGLPGEQLLMQDGMLYVRHEGQNRFRVVNDEKKWAVWNAAALPKKTRDAVETIPLTEVQYDAMVDIEKVRNGMSYAQLSSELTDLNTRFSRIRRRMQGNSAASTDSSTNYIDIIQKSDLSVYQLFARSDEFTRKLLSVSGGDQWFADFMTGWQKSPFVQTESDTLPDTARPELLTGGNLYDDANFRLNLLVKRTFGRLAVRTAELMAEGRSASLWRDDAELRAAFDDAEKLHLYVSLLDQRNMPIFPANASDGSPRYIPDNEFFMMGDNRFNSLDMRHSYDHWTEPLTKYDEFSVLRTSKMAPQSVPAKSILGAPVFRVWPRTRIGIPGLSAAR